MSFVNTCAGQLRMAINDLEALTHSRTKESFAKVKASIMKRMVQTADMLEGHFEIVNDEPKAEKKAPKKPAPRVTAREGSVIEVDFKTRARAAADSVFKK
jgi:hypothetical protein